MLTQILCGGEVLVPVVENRRLRFLVSNDSERLVNLARVTQAMEDFPCLLEGSPGLGTRLWMRTQRSCCPVRT